MIRDFTNRGEPPWPLTRLLHDYAYAVIGVSRSLSDAIAKERPQGHHSARQRKFFSLFPLYRATKVTNLRVQASSISRRRGPDVSESHLAVSRPKGSGRGLQHCKPPNSERVDAARASLKLSPDNHLERYETPPFHVEHFRGTRGTFCGTTRTRPEMDSVALNPERTAAACCLLKGPGHSDGRTFAIRDWTESSPFASLARRLRSAEFAPSSETPGGYVGQDFGELSPVAVP
jgi:hypothetical protein